MRLMRHAHCRATVISTKKTVCPLATVPNCGTSHDLDMIEATLPRAVTSPIRHRRPKASASPKSLPQNSPSNRRTWSHIETSTRKLARQYGTIHVVTGPAFTHAARMLNGRVRIPDYLWKAIYVPGVGAAAYVVRNDATQAYSVISISELPSKRSAALDLPPPTPHPGERLLGRVAFAWLVGSEKAGNAAARAPPGLVQHTGALTTHVLAYVR